MRLRRQDLSQVLDDRQTQRSFACISPQNRKIRRGITLLETDRQQSIRESTFRMTGLHGG